MIELVIFIIILSVLVLSHEFGHFIVAKKSGMRVDEFGFGFPPRLFGKKYGETTYTFNLIPFGGFVKIHGEDGGEGDGKDHDRRFTSKSLIKQAAVIVAGVVFNFLLAWLLFSVGFMTGLPTAIDDSVDSSRVENQQVIITSVAPESPAERVGLKGGDVVTAISSKDTQQDIIWGDDLFLFIQESGVVALTLTVRRGEEIKEVIVIPEEGLVEGRPAVGITFETAGLVSFPLHTALLEGGRQTIQFIGLTVSGFAGLIKDAIIGEASLDSVSGPVGIYTLVGEANRLGFAYLLSFTALISISLGVINLAPFPALDGGRLILVIVEAIKGSPVKASVANTLNYVGFAILLFLMVVVTYGDLIKLGLW